MKSLVLSLFLCGWITAAAFANGSIKGKVTDAQSGKPLVGASIYLHELRTGTITGADGLYQTAEIPSGTYLMEVSFMGYSAFLKTVRVDKTQEINIALKPSVVEHEAVTVTGVASAIRLSQNPQAISVVKKTDLQRSSGTNIIDALSRIVPGVGSLSTGPAVSKPIIRGLGYNRVITINDGVRQEGQQWGDEHGIEIDEASVQRVEILKGPASLLYGSDGMGGVVNIISNVPVERGVMKANYHVATNSNNGLISNHLNWSGHAMNGFNWNLYGSFKNAHAYQNKYDGRVLGSQFNERNFGGYIGVNKKWGYSHLLVSNFNQNFGMIEGDRDDATGKFILFAGSALERIATEADLKDRKAQAPSQGINHFKIALDNNIAWGTGRLQLNVGFQRNQRKEFGDPEAPGVPELYFDLKTVNYNVQYHFAEKNGWKTSMGINGMQQQNQNKAEEVLIPEYRLFDAGAFLYTRKTFNEKLTLSGGIRADYRKINSDGYTEGTEVKFESFNRSFSNMSGSIGLSYQASDNVTLKANLSRGYRAPSVTELASNGSHEGTNRYEYGDRNLKNETSIQADAGVEVRTQHFSFQVSAFYNSISNYIFYSKVSSVSGGDSLVNVDGEDLMAFKFKQNAARLYGFESKIDIHPHPLDWLHLASSFSVVAGRFKESYEGVNRLPFIPPARWTTELRGDFAKAASGSLRNFYVKLELDRVFAQNNIFSAYNTETVTPAFSLLNFGIGADVQSKGRTLFTIHASANNIADVAYQNHLSRLKYTAENMVTGRMGVFNMGRNFTLRLHVPLEWKLK